jgi:hypothetical protein
MAAGKFQIVAISPSGGSYGIDGSADINQPFPSKFDLKVSKYYSGPK